MTIQLDHLFSEPSGWKAALVTILASFAFFGIYVFFEFMGHGGSVETLVLGAAAGISGVAETLPNDRRRATIVLRFLALWILIGLLAVLLFSLAS